MPSPVKLAHAVLKTYDVARMREFYCKLLDAHVVFEALPAVSFITYDGEHHRLAFAQIPAEPVESVARSPAVTHLAFTFANVRDLLTQYERLRIQGINPLITINHGPTLSFYYQDPDKNNVECQIDRMSVEEGTRFMHTEHFRSNPIGVLVDADELVRKMHASASDEELSFYDFDAQVEVAAEGMRQMKLMNFL